MLSVSERLSSIKLKAPFQFLDGSFLFTQHTHEKYVASCTTSVYVNLSKNSFFCASTQIIDTSCRKSAALGKPQIHLVLHSLARFLGESECKGTTIINTIQILKQKNSQKHESFRESLQISNTHYIY